MNPLLAILARGRRRPFRIYYDEAYRLPITGVESGPRAMETRRADDVLHYLRHVHAVRPGMVVTPATASYSAMGRVHSQTYLESLLSPIELAHIFAVDPSDVYVDEVLRSVRLGVGGTMEAAIYSLQKRRPAVNLFGGFHHAAPERGAGFCAINDIAVAVAELRARGFAGRIGVIDLDFHPPDGTAACLEKDEQTWIGSISGADWGPLPRVDETLLPQGTRDEDYLRALEQLLGRMPALELCFVLAGADVLTGDRLGQFSLSLPGVRQRELMVARKLAGLPQVWLPAGGYSSHAWKVFAGVGMTLAFDTEAPVPTDYDPLAARFDRISRSIPSRSLGDDDILSDADLAEALGQPRVGPPKLLDFYTAEGMEFGLERYRVMPLLRRLGFLNLHVVIDQVAAYDRARVLGTDAMTGVESSLIELECEKRLLGDQQPFLFINWLTLRNPRAHFSDLRPQLPGQEVPGLGLAREMMQILTLMSLRLNLAGVAFRPSWFHMAYTARHGSRFIDAGRQGRFEALVRDSKKLSLLDATRAVADGRVKLNGQPYQWEADEMVRWNDNANIPHDHDAIAAERERCHFEFKES